MKLLVATTFVIVIAVTSRPADACKGNIDWAYKSITQIINYPPDGNASDWRFAVQELNQNADSARTCIGSRPAGPERTALEAEYKKLQAKITEVNAYVASYRELRLLDDELVTLRRKLATAGDVEAPAVAAQQRIARLTNHYATPAWRARHHDAFEALRVRQREDRAQAAAGAALERLASNSVVKRHAGKLTPEDSFRPDRIAEAFAAATPSDVVVTRQRPTYAPSPTQTTRMSDLHVRRLRDGNEPVYTGITDTYVRIDIDEAAQPELPDGIPALVWDTTPDGRTVIVTMDGGRYLAPSVQRVQAGLSPAATWPAEPIHTLLFAFDIDELGKLGVVDGKAAKALIETQDMYGGCAKRLWKAHDPAFDRIAASNISDSTKRARVAQLNTAVAGKIAASCVKHATNFDKRWRAIAKSYAATRAKVLERVRAHLVTLAK